ncbi:MAG: NAD(P)-binding domain-containing protein, partial [Clostridia bacterium]|nr:NAD(P)-binding domain-containing protein [Clostridia bacterium]
MKTITIIGAGMMGSALAFPAKENGNEVRLVGTPLDSNIIKACRKTGRHPKFNKDFPDGISYYQIEKLEEAIDGADFIICGVSSFGVEWFRDEILPKLKENVPVISVTKGLMNTIDGSLLTYLDIWQEKLDQLKKNIPLNAIGGPCTSYELVAHDQTEVTFCGNDLSVLRMIKSAIATEYYHISLSTDIVGVESAVALKNGYALGIALTIGLNQKNFGLDSELHFNSQAAMFGQSVREMHKLLKLQGADDFNNLVLGACD